MAKGNTPTKEERRDPAARGNSQADQPPAKGLPGFFRSTREELDRVVWPGRQQLVSESVAVLFIVLAFAAFIYLIDQGFSWVAGQVF